MHFVPLRPTLQNDEKSKLAHPKAKSLQEKHPIMGMKWVENDRTV